MVVQDLVFLSMQKLPLPPPKSRPPLLHAMFYIYILYVLLYVPFR